MSTTSCQEVFRSSKKVQTPAAPEQAPSHQEISPAQLMQALVSMIEAILEAQNQSINQCSQNMQNQVTFNQALSDQAKSEVDHISAEISEYETKLAAIKQEEKSMQILSVGLGAVGLVLGIATGDPVLIVLSVGLFAADALGFFDPPNPDGTQPENVFGFSCNYGGRAINGFEDFILGFTTQQLKNENINLTDEQKVIAKELLDALIKLGIVLALGLGAGGLSVAGKELFVRFIAKESEELLVEESENALMQASRQAVKDEQISMTKQFQKEVVKELEASLKKTISSEEKKAFLTFMEKSVGKTLTKEDEELLLKDSEKTVLSDAQKKVALEVRQKLEKELEAQLQKNLTTEEKCALYKSLPERKVSLSSYLKRLSSSSVKYSTIATSSSASPVSSLINGLVDIFDIWNPTNLSKEQQELLKTALTMIAMIALSMGGMILGGASSSTTEENLLGSSFQSISKKITDVSEIALALGTLAQGCLSFDISKNYHDLGDITLELTKTYALFHQTEALEKLLNSLSTQAKDYLNSIIEESSHTTENTRNYTAGSLALSQVLAG